MSVVEQKGNIAVVVVQEEINMKSFLNRATVVENIPKGKVTKVLKVYIVKDHKREELPISEYGKFYRDQSYIISDVYSSADSKVDKCTVYFWQGSESTILDKGASALLTVEVTDGFQGETVQVRVVEGKEPKSFLKLFGDSTVHIKSPKSEGVSVVYDLRSCFNGECHRLFELRNGVDGKYL